MSWWSGAGRTPPRRPFTIQGGATTRWPIHGALPRPQAPRLGERIKRRFGPAASWWSGEGTQATAFIQLMEGGTIRLPIHGFRPRRPALHREGSARSAHGPEIGRYSGEAM